MHQTGLTIDHQTTVVTVAAMNEVFLLSSGWIVAPSRTRIFCFPHPILTSVAYGVADPLITAAILWSKANPVFFLMQASLSHLLICSSSSTEIFESLLAASGMSEGDASEKAREARLEEAHSTPPPPPSLAFTTTMLTLSAVTAAERNAALLLLGQSLKAPSGFGYEPLFVFIKWLAVCMYFASWHGDYILSLASGRRWFPIFRTKSLAGAKAVLLSLAALLTVRTALRLALGLPLFIGFGFGVMDSALFEPGEREWLNAYNALVPPWMQSVISIVLSVNTMLLPFTLRRFQRRRNKDT